MLISWRLAVAVSVVAAAACRATDHREAVGSDTTRSEIQSVGANVAAPRFASYEEAVRFARSKYACEEDDTSESSFVRSAEFCVTTGGLGYLIVNLNGREYIHEAVPSTIWDGFKEASSKGQYYNAELRGRYRLELAY